MANENESAVLFVTKWALTRGIVKMSLRRGRTDGWWHDKWRTNYHVGRDAFRTHGEAQARVRKMAKAKLTSLQKAMAKAKKIADGEMVKVVDEVTP